MHVYIYIHTYIGTLEVLIASFLMNRSSCIEQWVILLLALTTTFDMVIHTNNVLNHILSLYDSIGIWLVPHYSFMIG